MASEKLKLIEAKLAEIRQKKKEFDAENDKSRVRSPPRDYSKVPKTYFHHPQLEYIFGEIVHSPYMTKPLEPYSTTTLTMTNELINMKSKGIKFKDLPPDQRPYDVKEVRKHFIRDIVNYRVQHDYKLLREQQIASSRAASPSKGNSSKISGKGLSSKGSTSARIDQPSSLESFPYTAPSSSSVLEVSQVHVSSSSSEPLISKPQHSSEVLILQPVKPPRLEPIVSKSESDLPRANGEPKRSHGGNLPTKIKASSRVLPSLSSSMPTLPNSGVENSTTKTADSSGAAKKVPPKPVPTTRGGKVLSKEIAIADSSKPKNSSGGSQIVKPISNAKSPAVKQQLGSNAVPVRNSSATTSKTSSTNSSELNQPKIVHSEVIPAVVASNANADPKIEVSLVTSSSEQVVELEADVSYGDDFADADNEPVSTAQVGNSANETVSTPTGALDTQNRADNGESQTRDLIEPVVDVAVEPVVIPDADPEYGSDFASEYDDDFSETRTVPQGAELVAPADDQPIGQPSGSVKCGIEGANEASVEPNNEYGDDFAESEGQSAAGSISPPVLNTKDQVVASSIEGDTEYGDDFAESYGQSVAASISPAVVNTKDQVVTGSTEGDTEYVDDFVDGDRDNANNVSVEYGDDFDDS